MYSTCLFCNRSLGENQVIEAFPVGRRLAFDEEKGRLWVICSGCRRWNLTPLEERWEAIEECEGIFRELRTRVHSEEIGAARHPEGLRLVRIGQPVPVEFATWRYGETMARRAQRRAVLSAVGVTGVAIATVSGVVPATAAGWALYYGAQIPQVYNVLKKRILVPLPQGGVMKVRPTQVDLTNPGSEGEMGVRVKYRETGEKKELFLFGEEARTVANRALPAFNQAGARRSLVKEVVKEIQEVGGMERYLQETWGKARPRPGSTIRWIMSNDMKGGSLRTLPTTTRYALEMSLQEERERRAMEGELAMLEAAWREAETLAKISDDLLVPPEVEEKLDELRRKE